jgi:ergothioneine biosynthesis protein EgtB
MPTLASHSKSAADSHGAARPALLERYRAVRAQSAALTGPLAVEDQVVQSMPNASPTKWHLAHTSWFFEEFVLDGGLQGYRRHHPAYGYLFNSYYEAVGARHPRPERGLLTRPTVAEIDAYRAAVDQAMARFFAEAGEAAFAARAGLIELGLNHEQQHQELLLTDIKHMLSCNPLRPAYRTEPAPASSGLAAPPLGWTPRAGGIGHLGAEAEGFAFDNERPRHRVISHDHRLASRPVSNGEFTAFMVAGGYRTATLWLSDGWATVQALGWQAPLYWEERDGTWWHFTLHGMRPVDPAVPVCHVSYYEADAFARFAGKRLPCEAEWELAARDLPCVGNFIESGALQPSPSQIETAAPTQLYGDVWEWTRSPYVAYPGYRPAAGAVGEYNGKFMCNQLVLRGGSCVTPSDHIRPTYRNFFPPDARWQFSGIRLAEDA